LIEKEFIEKKKANLYRSYQRFELKLSFFDFQLFKGDRNAMTFGAVENLPYGED
jgi:hypothetical protein